MTPGADATRAEQLRSFVHRDWALVEELKRSHWVERARRMTPTEKIRVAEDLQQLAHALHPDWPTKADRDADLAEHIRAVGLTGDGRRAMLLTEQGGCMAENDDRQSESRGERFHPGWVILTVALGVAFILAARRMGKAWSLGEILYDVGVAGITVAIVELLFLRVLGALGARKTKLEKLWDELKESREYWNKKGAELEQTIGGHQIDAIFKNSFEVLTRIQTLAAEMKAIRVHVDPEYAELIRLTEPARKE